MKNSLVPIAIVLTIITVFLIFNSTQTVRNIRQTLDVERYQRMTAEEKLQQAESRIRMLESQINESQGKIENIQAILNDKETQSQDTVAQMDSLSKEKAALETKLKEYQGNLAEQTQARTNP